MYTILVSSLNENMSLAESIQTHLNDLNVKSQIINLVEINLPLYDSRKETIDGIPKQILELMKILEESKAYIIVSPEYNYSIPPVLTNVIAWISRASDDFRKVFSLKYIQLATHSGANGYNVVNAMRSQLTNLGAICMPREILSTYSNKMKEESILKVLKIFIEITKK